MAKLVTWTKRALAVLAVMLGGPALAAVTGVVDIGQDWRTANRDSVGLSPTPADEPEAVLQVLGGRAFVDLIREETHTCYRGDHVTRHAWGYGCGVCPACELRAKGYAEWRAMA